MKDYKNTKWLKKRAYILKRDGYICQESKRYGRIVQASHVHHIFPLETYPELKYANWNLIALSREAHNTMHDRNTDAITSKGKYWQRKRRKEFKEWEKGKQRQRRFK